MAPRVQFYHNTPDRLALTRELVSSAHERGRKVAICCADAAQLKRLDQLLWTGEPLSFEADWSRLGHVPDVQHWRALCALPGWQACAGLPATAGLDQAASAGAPVSGCSISGAAT